MEKLAWVKSSGRVSRTHYVTEEGKTKCGRDIPDNLEHLTGDDCGPMCARCEPDAEARTDPNEMPRRSPRRKRKKKTERKRVWEYVYEEVEDVDIDYDDLCESCRYGAEIRGRAWLCNTCSSLGVDKIEVVSDNRVIYSRKKYITD